MLFWGAAIFGTVFFLLRTALFFVGGADASDSSDDIDDILADAGDIDGADADVDASSDTSDAHEGIAEAGNGAFRLLSLNSITGFIGMFGWAGLAASKQFTLNLPLSLLTASGAGFAVMLLTALLFHGAMKLKSGGASFDIELSRGLEASVYLHIPSDGTGRVSFIYDGVKHEADAVSETGEEIASFEKVLIIRAVDGRTVSVAPFTA